MATSYMTHNVKGISEVALDPTNNNVLSFTLDYHNGDYTNFSLFGMDYGVAKSLYDSLRGNPKESKRVDQLEQALERIAYGPSRITDIGEIAKEALYASPDYEYVPF